MIDDIVEYLNDNPGIKNTQLVDKIEKNTLRYLELFKETIFALLPSKKDANISSLDSIDVLTAQREKNNMTFPLELKAKFETFIRPRANEEITPIRNLRAEL